MNNILFYLFINFVEFVILIKALRRNQHVDILLLPSERRTIVIAVSVSFIYSIVIAHGYLDSSDFKFDVDILKRFLILPFSIASIFPVMSILIVVLDLVHLKRLLSILKKADSKCNMKTMYNMTVISKAVRFDNGYKSEAILNDENYVIYYDISGKIINIEKG